MATVNSQPTVATPAGATGVRTGAGRLEVLGTIKKVPVSPSPFTLPLVLPMVILSFFLADLALFFRLDLNGFALAICGGLMVLGSGSLLISAVGVGGELELNEAGVVYRRGRKTVSAPWSRVAGVTNGRGSDSLTLILANPALSHKRISMPGGFVADENRAHIPLRYFGLRQDDILETLAAHLTPEQSRIAFNARTHPNVLATRGMLVVTAAICIACVIVATVFLS